MHLCITQNDVKTLFDPYKLTVMNDMTIRKLILS